MATASLTASVRSNVGKGVARSLRRDGRIPGVIYGHNRQPQPVALSTRELDRLLSQVNAETTVIDLSIDGTSSRTLIREIQRHPLSQSVIHIDFQELVAGEKVIVNVPIVLLGIPLGVRLAGGIMTQVLSDLEVRVDPAEIPSRIEVEVTELAIGHSLHVSDLNVPAGVEIMSGSDETVVNVAAPKEEVVETPVAEAEAAVAPTEPELIRKPKADEDAAEK
ncbi:MAG: 50S ribosomal protein L25/general stress protein Ctc [Gemmatimonadota bacterium]